MKRTDLYKLAGQKINEEMKRAGSPGRFGNEASAVPDRREQRKLDQAQGLVAFAVKLDSELIKQVQTQALNDQTGLNETVAALLAKGLAARA
jgi:hypothetical protein